MAAAYGLRVWEPGLPLGRFAALLERLPPWARNGGQPWSTESELLAGLIDSVAQLTWVTLRAHGAKNVARPKPIPRPGQRRPRPPAAIPEPSRGKSGGGWDSAASKLALIPGVSVSHG